MTPNRSWKPRNEECVFARKLALTAWQFALIRQSGVNHSASFLAKLSGRARRAWLECDVNNLVAQFCSSSASESLARPSTSRSSYIHSSLLRSNIILSEHCTRLISCTNAVRPDYTFGSAIPDLQNCETYKASEFLTRTWIFISLELPQIILTFYKIIIKTIYFYISFYISYKSVCLFFFFSKKNTNFSFLAKFFF